MSGNARLPNMQTQWILYYTNTPFFKAIIGAEALEKRAFYGQKIRFS